MGITLREFEAERQRLRSAAEALGQTLDVSTERERLVNEFIDQLLLAQAAYASGYQDDEAVLEAKISALKTTLGGDVAWQQWLTAHNYTEVDYRQALARAWRQHGNEIELLRLCLKLSNRFMCVRF